MDDRPVLGRFRLSGDIQAVEKKSTDQPEEVELVDLLLQTREELQLSISSYLKFRLVCICVVTDKFTPINPEYSREEGAPTHVLR